MGKQKFGQTSLDNAMERARREGGGITPGAHPPTVAGQDNFAKLTDLASKAGKAVLGVMNKINKTGSNKSPSMVKDK